MFRPPKCHCQADIHVKVVYISYMEERSKKRDNSSIYDV